jgi:hypothetical protein
MCSQRLCCPAADRVRPTLGEAGGAYRKTSFRLSAVFKKGNATMIAIVVMFLVVAFVVLPIIKRLFPAWWNLINTP